nr:hypothetical protein [Paracoccus rhizosphaerae]
MHAHVGGLPDERRVAANGRDDVDSIRLRCCKHLAHVGKDRWDAKALRLSLGPRTVGIADSGKRYGLLCLPALEVKLADGASSRDSNRQVLHRILLLLAERIISFEQILQLLTNDYFSITDFD